MLIIVESPAKAKTISQILSSFKEFQGSYVRASKGHIRVISDTNKSSEGKKLEINGIDIDNNFSPIYDIDDAKKDVITELKKLAKNSDIILFATDEDREGEAISWHLSEILGIKDKSQVKRMVFHEITKTAILKAIKEPRKLDLNLVAAQQARQVLDKLVGYKLSPILWKTLGNYSLSAGRVQSPALRLICGREDEITIFVPKEYWEIRGKFLPFDQKNNNITKNHPATGLNLAKMIQAFDSSNLNSNLNNNLLPV